MSGGNLEKREIGNFENSQFDAEKNNLKNF